MTSNYRIGGVMLRLSTRKDMQSHQGDTFRVVAPCSKEAPELLVGPSFAPPVLMGLASHP
jgi:hypothetical protein